MADRLVVGFLLIAVWPAIVGVMAFDAGLKSRLTKCPDGWVQAKLDGRFFGVHQNMKLGMPTY